MPGNSSDTYENLKKAFKSIFRRKKPVVVKATPQVAPRATSKVPPRLRPRSASATAAPEAIETTSSWPLLNQSPTTGHFHATAIELPGSLLAAPFPGWQQRSKSDVGQPLDNSDLFSELDSNSIRRESVVGLVTPSEHVQELDSPSIDQHTMPRFGSEPQLDSTPLQASPEATISTGIIPEESTEDDEEEDIEQEDQPEHEQEDEPEFELAPEPENKQEHGEEDVSQIEETPMDVIEELDEPEYTIPVATSVEDLARNDSANGRAIKDDGASSIYTTDDSAEEDFASDDEGAPSTPRTASVVHADSVEYFDEKIPVLSEPPPVIRLTPAPGMAATSGPLEDFPFS